MWEKKENPVYSVGGKGGGGNDKRNLSAGFKRKFPFTQKKKTPGETPIKEDR